MGRPTSFVKTRSSVRSHAGSSDNGCSRFLVVMPNVGQETGYVVTVTDAEVGSSAALFRVQALRLQLQRERSPGEYRMRLRLSAR